MRQDRVGIAWGRHLDLCALIDRHCRPSQRSSLAKVIEVTFGEHARGTGRVRLSECREHCLARVEQIRRLWHAYNTGDGIALPIGPTLYAPDNPNQYGRAGCLGPVSSTFCPVLDRDRRACRVAPRLHLSASSRNGEERSKEGGSRSALKNPLSIYAAVVLLAGLALFRLYTVIGTTDTVRPIQLGRPALLLCAATWLRVQPRFAKWVIAAYFAVGAVKQAIVLPTFAGAALDVLRRPFSVGVAAWLAYALLGDADRGAGPIGNATHTGIRSSRHRRSSGNAEDGAEDRTGGPPAT
jgi:hypothetical protein